MREFKDHKAPSRSSEPFFKPKVQPKLAVGQPGDQFEKEADSVADKVVSRSGSGDVQKAAQPEEEKVRQQPIAGSISSVQLKDLGEDEKVQQQPEEQKEEPVQKQEDEKESLQKKDEEQKEPLQKQEEDKEPVQKMGEKEEEKTPVQKKDEEQKDPLQKQEEDKEPVQKMGEKEEEQQEPLQKQADDKEKEEQPVQKKKEEEKDPLQKKAEQDEQEKPVQKKENGNAAPAASTEARLSGSKGEGAPLAGEAKQEMESGFGADFGHVRIHNDSKAERLSSDLGAQAFTHGNDIYFNKGKYNPSSRQGKHLLAHELTHTIQQKGAIQQKEQPVQASFFGKIWGGIKSAGKAVWSGVKSVGKAVAGGVKAIAGYSWDVLKSAGAWIWNLASETPTRMWRLLQHVGSGIVGTMSWVWEGIKGGAGHLWDALSGTFSWLKQGVTGLFDWVWTGVRGGAKWAWKLLHGDFSGFWDGIADGFSWLGKGVKGLVKWGWEGIKAASIWASQGVVGLAKWIGRGIVSGAAWSARLITKLLDLVGFGEIMDLLFNIVKFNTRTLNSTERQEAQRVFGNSISYWQIRIDEHSLISAIGAWFQNSSGMGVTLFHTINFNHPISAAAGNSDMRWLIHEMTHVSQYEHVGSQYIGEAIHAQSTAGYGYGDGAGIVGKNLKDFNREQQADIIAHYYYYILAGNVDPRYSPYAAEYNRMADQARSGKF